MSRHHASFIFSTAMLALLSACGGGGGSDSGASSASTTPVAISSSNQVAASRATIAGGLTVAQGASAIEGNSSDHAAAASTTHSAVQLGASLVELPLRRALAAFRDQRRVSIAGATAHPASATPQSCDLSGAFTVTPNDHDNDGQISNGDSVNFTFDHCKYSDGSVINGVVILTASGTVNETQAHGSASYQQFTITSGTSSFRMNGNFAVAETVSGSETDDTLTIGSNGLTVGVTSSAYNDTITYFSGMQVTTQYSSSQDQGQISLDGTFSATSLNGEVTITTITPIVQADSQDYPSAGEVRIAGANGTSLVMTVVSNPTQVELQVYDGQTLVNTTTKSWTELLPL